MGDRSLYCEADGEFFRKIAEDLNEWTGAVNPGGPNGPTNPDGSPYYAFSIFQRDKSANFDPVYQEIDITKDPVFIGGFRLPVPVEYEEAEGHYNQLVTEEGVEREYDAIAYIDRNSWADRVLGDSVTYKGFAQPNEGDVVVMFMGDPDKERWFDVQKVEKFGYVLTSPDYTGWKLTLNDRSSLEAVRRLENQNA
jgi:hypothetical protein